MKQNGSFLFECLLCFCDTFVRETVDRLQNRPEALIELFAESLANLRFQRTFLCEEELSL